jgi:hypothetical protein
MPDLLQNILNQIKCCISVHEHISIQPVLLKCGGNACKNCIYNLKYDLIECYCCYEKHEKKDLLNSPSNKIVETIIYSSLNELFRYVEIKIEDASIALKSKFYAGDNF